jgi:hypothetical protein
MTKSPNSERIVPSESADDKEPNTDKTRRPSENREDQRIADAIRAVNRTLADQGEANRREDRSEDIGNKWLQGLTLLFVIATTIGIFWQGSIFNSQLTEMKGAGEQTKQLIEANGKLAEATSKQAAAASENAKTAHDSYVASQRAWVGPTNAKIDGEIAVDKPLKIAINYVNTGREPAITFLSTADAFLSAADDETSGITLAKVNADFKGCRDASVTNGGTVVFPSTGGISPSGQTLTITKSADFVTQAVIDGDTIIVADGCFLYKSIAIVRHSYFCYFYKSKQTDISSLNICRNGNGAD